MFRGDRAFLSNFYPSPITVDGILYPTVEHAFQAAKTDSTEHKLRIASAATPAIAKRIGRTVPLVPHWNKNRLNVMYTLLLLKFSDPVLQSKLLSTHSDQLVEHNTWNDTYWGVCKGVGANHLGKLLMQVRDYYTHADRHQSNIHD